MNHFIQRRFFNAQNLRNISVDFSFDESMTLFLVTEQREAVGIRRAIPN